MNAGSQTIVIDSGTNMTRYGFSGQKEPRLIHSVVGRSSHSTRTLIGKRAILAHEKKHDLSLSWPVDGYRIRNWDDLESMWDFIFDHKLKVDPSEHTVLLAEQPLNSRKNKEKMAEMMFEKFKTPSLFMGIQSVLSLFSSGHTSGLVIDSGANVSYSVPCYEGYAITHAIERLTIGGNDVTAQFSKRLTSNKPVDANMIKSLKETYCYIKPDSSSISPAEVEYQLPDGNTIRIGDEAFMAPEILFNPLIFDLDLPGIHDFVHRSITKSSIDVRRKLYSNIVLAGGNTLLRGFQDRIKHEVKNLALPSIDVQVIAPNDRMFSAWIGGSILGLISSFPRMCLSRNDYYEKGAAAIFKYFL